jgi:hypothetical protein
MPRTVALPPELHSVPFHVTTAYASGVGRGRLRGADLEAPHRGIRVLPSSREQPDAPSVLDRCAEVAPLLAEDQHFSHLTAARLWGIPLPRPFTPSEPLHVTSMAPQRAPRIAGVVGHQASRWPRAERHGFPVSDAVDTWLALAPTLSFPDLVAAAEHLVLDPYELDPRDIRPHCRPEELGERVRRYSRRGARKARLAASAVRLGVESRPETLLRLLLVAAGLPEPEPGVELTAKGRRYRVDMYYRERRVVVEYDGDQHRTSTGQYERDITRIDDLIAVGEKVVRVRSHGLFQDPDGTVERVREALEASN